MKQKKNKCRCDEIQKLQERNETRKMYMEVKKLAPKPIFNNRNGIKRPRKNDLQPKAIEITNSELMKVIQRLGNNKATGINEIPLEYLKRAGKK